MTDQQLQLDPMMHARLALSDNFRPGTAINTRTLFAGRATEMASVIAAVTQPGQHAVIFGERGVGKTSLAKVVAEMVRSYGYITLPTGTINCDGMDNFSTVWHKVFREISLATSGRTDAGFQPNAPAQQVFTLDSMLNETVSPDDVRFVLSRVNGRVLIALDEVDKVKERAGTTALLADTVKALADHAPHVTVLLIGIADTVEGLITEHKSVERSLIQVRMPRMKLGEIGDILKHGFSAAGMTIDDSASRWIVQLSQGLPHYTHMLGLYSGQVALENGRTNVTAKDVNDGINHAVERSFSLLTAYDKAVISPQRNNRYASVLLACAMATRDELGWFPAAAVAGPLSKIEGKRATVPDFARHLQQFCDKKRGPILQAKGTARGKRYRFVDPMMEPFTVLHGYRDGRLPLKEESTA